MPIFAVQPMGSDSSVAAYENLRRHVLAGTAFGSPFGLVLLLREGLAAWVSRGATSTATLEPAADPEPRAAAPNVSDGIRASAERTCARCGREKVQIGHEVSEKLAYVPASFHVVQTRRVKRACPQGHGVTVAPSAPQAVEKALAAEGLLAHVVVSKYADQLPLHRQEAILARHGVSLSRSTQCAWVREVARACAPIAEEIRRQVLAADYLQTDDTSVVVLGGDEGSFKGRLWTSRPT